MNEDKNQIPEEEILSIFDVPDEKEVISEPTVESPEEPAEEIPEEVPDKPAEEPAILEDPSEGIDIGADETAVMGLARHGDAELEQIIRETSMEETQVVRLPQRKEQPAPSGSKKRSPRLRLWKKKRKRMSPCVSAVRK